MYDLKIVSIPGTLPILPQPLVEDNLYGEQMLGLGFGTSLPLNLHGGP